MSEKDRYLSWLNDAYAMEKNVEQVLQNHSKQAQDFPEIKNKIDQHIDVTRNQADMVKDCIERNGGNVSSIKSGLANLMGNLAGAATGPSGDTLIKNTLAEFGTENFEIASYTSLIDAAQTLGDTQTAQVCQQILREEQEMASWLMQNLPRVSQISLQDAAS
jgi:ferritin-like metal-binding protein YciE